MKKIAIVVFILMSLFIVAACGGDDTNGEGQAVASFPDEYTFLGTRRGDTLIVELQFPVEIPGQFNTFMGGTSITSGIVQLTSGMLWEINTITGEQFPEIAYGFPISNEDYTEHIVHIRQGIYWSDGMPLTARDVAFTMNMIKGDPNIGVSGFYNSIFYSIEATDDFTVRMVTHFPFPRIALTFGVTIGGNALRIVPEHIYSHIDEVTEFADSNPVVAGAYTIHSWDPLGNWVLFERRADWYRSTVGVVQGRMPQAQYVLFRSFGDDTTRQMAMINNEIDLMMEVSPEMLTIMAAQNPNVAAWYDRFPFATSDDPVAKGLVFNQGIAPFDNRYFRWGIALALDFDTLTLAILDGVGRSSPFPVFTQTSSFLELFYRPYLMDWIDNFYLTLADGSVIFPYDRGYAHRIAEVLRARGHYYLPTEASELYYMFGYGTWVHDPVAATQLFQMAGLELRGDDWYFEGQPFVIEFSYLAGTELQTERSVQAAFNQLVQFGFNATLQGKTMAAWATDWVIGNFQIDGYWPWGFITQDVYAQILTFDRYLIAPVGEVTGGDGARWDNQRATEIIHEMAWLHPDNPRNRDLTIEFFQVAVYDLPTIGFHSGVKFVPTNSTYWHNFPTAANPYNGPWWWWHVFGHFLVEITPNYPS